MTDAAAVTDAARRVAPVGGSRTSTPVSLTCPRRHRERTDRYLDGFSFPFPEWKAFRVEAMVHAPAAFEAHGTLVAERDLTVV